MLLTPLTADPGLGAVCCPVLLAWGCGTRAALTPAPFLAGGRPPHLARRQPDEPGQVPGLDGADPGGREGPVQVPLQGGCGDGRLLGRWVRCARPPLPRLRVISQPQPLSDHRGSASRPAGRAGCPGRLCPGLALEVSGAVGWELGGSPWGTACEPAPGLGEEQRLGLGSPLMPPPVPGL